MQLGCVSMAVRRIPRFFSCMMIFVSICAGRSTSFPTPLSPRIANYDIEVRLNAGTRTLDGHELLRWRNTSLDTIHELQFHLYLNGFRNSRSTFMVESASSARPSKIENDGWGFIDITRVSLPSGEDATALLQFIHPDDDNADDRTVVRLPLTRPLSPGDSIALSLDFTARLPQPPLARTGAKEEYFFVGQWFPKIGVYIDSNWNCHQFHATTEFFADFGVYNVRIIVPEKNIVGGTGLEVEVKPNDDGTATHVFHAEDVHDFAWTTSPKFVEFKGKAENVDIRVLMQPDHAGQGMRHVDAAIVAIKYFHKWYGAYPFPNLTVVDPRRGAGASGGMEYPTLITAGTIYGVPDGFRSVEDAIVHEFGHNYWYHLLASNEFEESWLDEGINSYTEFEIMNEQYGPQGDVVDVMGVKANILQLQRAAYLNSAGIDPIVRNGWQYYSGNSYGVNSYTKPGLLLTTLQHYLGRGTMLKAMRTYVERWSFKHPHSKDFVAVVNEISGQNLDWFFDQALYTNAILDYSVDQVSTRELLPDRGFNYTIFANDSVRADPAAVKQEKSTDSMLYLSEVKVRRLGTFIFPVEVEAKFADGKTIREHWDGKDLWKKYRYTRASKLVSATVDPDQKIPLDIDYINNSRTIEVQRLGMNKTAIRFMFWVQSLFDQPEWLNLVTFIQGLL